MEAHRGVTGVSLTGKDVEPHLFHVSPSCIPLGGWRPELLSILWLEFGGCVSLAEAFSEQTPITWMCSSDQFSFRSQI